MRKYKESQIGRMKIRLYERSAKDVLSAGAIAEEANIIELSLILIRDSVKYNFRWYNPLSWIKVHKLRIKNLYELPKREILELAMGVLEVEGGEVTVYKYLLKQLSEIEEKKYLEKLKKKETE